MTRQERKGAAREALAKLWRRCVPGTRRRYKIDDVAEALGVDRRTVSQWWMGRLAPDHKALDRLRELSEPEFHAEVWARIRRLRELASEMRELDAQCARIAQAHGWPFGGG